MINISNQGFWGSTGDFEIVKLRFIADKSLEYDFRPG